MNDYLSVNLNAAGNRFNGFSSFTAPMDSPRVKVTLSRSGDPVPSINRDGRDFPMHSLFDPFKEGQKLIATYPLKGMKIFFGLAGGYQIRPFLADSKILIIDPDESLLMSLLTELDFHDLLSHSQVYLLCRPDHKTLSSWLKGLYNPLLDGNFQVIPHRAYIEKDVFLPYERMIKSILEEISSDCSTQKRLGRQWQRNIILNLSRVCRSPFTPDLIQGFDRAVITAAGPGLEREMDGLSRRSPGTFLLSVDTALPALLEKGIVPDGVITIDPQAIGYLHFMGKLPFSCRVFADWGAPLPPGIEESRIYWFSSPHPLCRYFRRKGRLPLPEIETGGNVTQAALALLRHSSIREITLLGADFSYPEGKPYCRGSYFHTWYHVKDRRLCPCENSLLHFVLERSSLTESPDSGIYTSPLLRQYEKNLGDYVESTGGRIKKEGRGKWTIKWNPIAEDLPPPEIPFQADALLNQYTEELNAIKETESISHSSVLPTLIPLGYSFYDNEGEKALQKSLLHTLKIINTRNS